MIGKLVSIGNRTLYVIYLGWLTPEFVEKFSANKFALSDAKDKTTSQGALNTGGIAYLPLLTTLSEKAQLSSDDVTLSRLPLIAFSHFRLSTITDSYLKLLKSPAY